MKNFEDRNYLIDSNYYQLLVIVFITTTIIIEVILFLVLVFKQFSRSMAKVKELIIIATVIKIRSFMVIVTIIIVVASTIIMGLENLKISFAKSFYTILFLLFLDDEGAILLVTKTMILYLITITKINDNLSDYLIIITIIMVINSLLNQLQ